MKLNKLVSLLLRINMEGSIICWNLVRNLEFSLEILVSILKYQEMQTLALNFK